MNSAAGRWPLDAWSQLSRWGRLLALLALALLALNIGLWQQGVARADRLAAGEQELTQAQGAFDQLKAADARDQRRRAGEQELAARRQRLLAPLLAQDYVNPTTLALDAARELNVSLASVRTDRRSVLYVLNQRLEQTDVHVEYRGPLNQTVWLLEGMERASGRLLLRGLALSRVPEGWRSAFSYRVFRAAPNQ